MKPTSRVVSAVALAMALPVLGAGAAPAPPGAPRAAADEMKALSWLAGEWEGEAWIIGPGGQKSTVQQRERVEWKTGGEVLLIQGRGVMRDPQSGEERLVHDTLATLAWDPGSGRHVMWTYRAGGGPGKPEVTVDGSTVVWGFPVGGSHIRFTIRRDGEGRWVETGERSADGTTWTPFFGMTLVRTAPPRD